MLDIMVTINIIYQLKYIATKKQIKNSKIMKKILLTSFLLTLISVSCEKNIQNTQITKEIESVEHLNKNFSVIVIDSCEYLHGSYDRMTHKGNCKFCEVRERKLLDDYYIDECDL
jgi:hypothetical protein